MRAQVLQAKVGLLGQSHELLITLLQGCSWKLFFYQGLQSIEEGLVLFRFNDLQIVRIWPLTSGRILHPLRPSCLPSS